MSLIRVSEKKLAANRANARLSRGPSTPQGKERSSQNACKHHLYAKKHKLPPTWRARIWQVIEPCLAGIDDPRELAATLPYLVLNQWIIELFAYETRLLNQSIARHRSYPRGVYHFAKDPLFLAIEARRHSLHIQAERARVEWLRKRTTPNVVETKPLVMAAAAAIASPTPQNQPIQTATPSQQLPPTRILRALDGRHPLKRLLQINGGFQVHQVPWIVNFRTAEQRRRCLRRSPGFGSGPAPPRLRTRPKNQVSRRHQAQRERDSQKEWNHRKHRTRHSITPDHRQIAGGLLGQSSAICDFRRSPIPT
jgi:hypothetical protein